MTGEPNPALPSSLRAVGPPGARRTSSPPLMARPATTSAPPFRWTAARSWWGPPRTVTTGATPDRRTFTRSARTPHLAPWPCRPSSSRRTARPWTTSPSRCPWMGTPSWWDRGRMTTGAPIRDRPTSTCAAGTPGPYRKSSRLPTARPMIGSAYRCPWTGTRPRWGRVKTTTVAPTLARSISSRAAGPVGASR